MITFFTELSGFGTDYSICVKLADLIAVFSDIVFFAECLKPSDSALVIENGGIIIPGMFQRISNVQTVFISILKHLLRIDASSIKHYTEKSFIMQEKSGSIGNLRHSFFFGIIIIIPNSG